MGGIIITLTRGMDELTYKLSLTTCNLVLVECLGGLFFDGKHFCTEDSFAGHLGLYCGNFLAAGILVCV